MTSVISFRPCTGERIVLDAYMLPQRTIDVVWHTLSERHAMPPFCDMIDAALKHVVMIRVKSLITGVPSANWSASGTTVQPSLIPVKPAYLEKEHVSMATYNTGCHDDHVVRYTQTLPCTAVAVPHQPHRFHRCFSGNHRPQCTTHKRHHKQELTHSSLQRQLATRVVLSLLQRL